MGGPVQRSFSSLCRHHFLHVPSAKESHGLTQIQEVGGEALSLQERSGELWVFLRCRQQLQDRRRTGMRKAERGGLKFG